MLLTLKGDDSVGVEEDVAGGRFAIVRIVGVTGVRITDWKSDDVAVEHDAKVLGELDVAHEMFDGASMVS